MFAAIVGFCILLHNYLCCLVFCEFLCIIAEFLELFDVFVGFCVSLHNYLSCLMFS